MSKVNDQYQLNNYEKEAADHAEVHPRYAEGAFGYEEGSDHPADHQEVLYRPEAVKIWF